MNTKTYIWRDSIDGDNFWLGVNKTHNGVDSYTGWTPIFVDALGDLFRLSSEEISSITTEPTEITLVLSGL